MMQSSPGHEAISQHSTPSKVHCWKHLSFTTQMDASSDACGAQLSQEHDGQELLVAFLSHTLTKTQWKWNTTEQEAYGIYYAMTK